MALSNVLAKAGNCARAAADLRVVTFVPGNGDHEERADGPGHGSRARRGRVSRGGRGREEELPGLAGARRRPRDHARRRARVAAPAPRPVVGARAEPGADRVRQHVGARRLEVLVVAHLPEREAVSPEVAGAPVLRVEPLGVEAVHPVQRAREQRRGRTRRRSGSGSASGRGRRRPAGSGRRRARAERGTPARRRGRGRPSAARHRASWRARRRTRETSIEASEPSRPR